MRSFKHSFLRRDKFPLYPKNAAEECSSPTDSSAATSDLRPRRYTDVVRATRLERLKRINLIVIVIFGVAFGFVEAAVVYYLRALIHFHQNYAISSYKVLLNLGFITFVQPAHSLFLNHRVSDVEIAREAATIVMLAALSFVAANRWPQRLGAFLVSFACWDLAYYLFLRLVGHWPRSFFTRDVFFLIPVTWIGPVLTPIVLSFVILIIGSYLYLRER